MVSHTVKGPIVSQPAQVHTSVLVVAGVRAKFGVCRLVLRADFPSADKCLMHFAAISPVAQLT